MSLSCSGCKDCQKCYWMEHWSKINPDSGKWCADMTCSRKFVDGDHDGFLKNNWLAPIKVRIQAKRENKHGTCCF